MLKRLLTAVFVLGCFMLLSGTAFSGTTPPEVVGKTVKGDLSSTASTNTGESLLPKGYVTPANRPAENHSHQPMVQGHFRPAGAGVDTTECYIIGWADWVNATYFISFPRRSNHNNQGLAMRYDGPSLPNYVVQVNGAYNWIYRVAEGVPDGQAGIVVEVWDDIGGLPNTLVYTETFVVPAFANQPNYLYFPFTTPPTLTGNYHISFKPDPTGPSTDTIVFTSDDAGYTGIGGTATVTGRGSQYSVSAGMWLTVAAYNGGALNVNFDQFSDFCQYYTECYTEFSPLTSVSLFTVPGPPQAPAGGASRLGFGQRFLAAGPETLKTVTIYHYDYNASAPGAYYTPASTNYPVIKVWGDSAGHPYVSAGPLASVNGPSGLALFPQTGLAGDGFNYLDIDFSSFNLVLLGGYHITMEMAVPTPVNAANGRLLMLVSNEPTTDFSGADVMYTPSINPAYDWKNTGVHPVWNGISGLPEVGFLIEPTLCKDEFSACQVQPSYMVGAHLLLYMDMCGWYGSRNGIAAKFVGTPVNRIEKVRFQLTDETFDAYPDVPNSVVVSIFTSIGGAMGSAVYSDTLTNAEITMLPGWTEVVIPDVIASNEFFVAVEPIFTLDGDNEWLYFARERVTTTPGVTQQINGGMWVKLCADNLWYQNNTIAALDNFICEADFCSIPPSTWACGAADDYPTNAHDYGRTGHSNVALTDAYCDLNNIWKYTDPGFGSTAAGGGAITFNAPIIYDTFVVMVQNSKLNILELNTGTVLASFTGNVAPYYMAVSLVRSTPTIATINVAGIPTLVMFYGGGSSMMAVKMEPGFPALWDLRSANAVAKGYAAGDVASGFTNYTAPVVVGQTVYFGTGTSRILAADAETGNKLWGATLISTPVRNLAYDGTALYAATIAAPPAIPDGDVYAINPATGAIFWQLSTAGGYYGTTVDGSTNETFADQLAVHNGELFAVSAYFTPVFDDEGILYNINAVDGSLNWTSPTQHIYQGGGLTVGPNVMIDAAKIIVPGGATWTSTPFGGTMIAHNRFTGGIDWISDAGPAKTTGSNLSNGFMTCENGLASQIYIWNSDGYLSCFNADDGNEIFHRRLDYLSLGFNSQGAGGAIADDGKVVFGTFAGELYMFDKTTDRGRLEIIDYTPTTPVSFGNSLSLLVPLPDIYTNTGCATISGNMIITDAPNGSVGPGAQKWSDFDVTERAASIADQITSRSVKAFKGAGLVTVTDETTVDVSSTRTLNRAAAAVPVWLNNAAVTPIVVNPGDTFDVVLDVNQSILPRGPNKVYIQFDTDDPDFFVNNVTEDPEVLATLVGGCLIDTTHLHFGAGSANLQTVANSGRLGTGDWNPTPGNFDILGDAVSFYQGTYVYGVTRNRVALNSQDWWSGGGEADSWISMQADPNRCNDDCKPALQTGVSLGSITTDGISYTPLTGNLVCKDYIDSVLIYDPDGAGAAAWNWLNFETAFFDADSTMGLYVSTSTFGAVDVAAPYEMLNDVSVEVMKVKTRNGQQLDNWKFGVGIDYDIVNPDTCGIDRTISTVFTYGADANLGAKVWGMVKLPFGGGCAGEEYTPLKNTKALDRAQSMTSSSAGGTARGNGFVDSSYFWMSQPIGGSSQGSMHSADDQDVFATFVEKSFAAGGDSIMFAIAHFAMVVDGPTNSANYAPLATLLNKWVGYGRGDINNDGIVNLADIIALADNVAGSGPGAIPFAHLGDVNNDGSINSADVTYLVNYYFHYGPCPVGAFIIQ